MFGSFAYDNPTRLHFGEDSLNALAGELASCGPVVQLVYGGGSIRKNGIYDQVCAVLKAAGKTIVDDAGVMPNPTIDRVLEGVARAREAKADLLLAVGGGSCCDYAKAVAASVHLAEDPWDFYFERCRPVPADMPVLPVGCVVTMAGTGSEMNGTSVITNPAMRAKKNCKFGPRVFPKFAILNPAFTLTLPDWQMRAGIFDTFNHIGEAYFSGTDDSVSDYISEGLMRSVIHAGRVAVKNPQDYEARSNLMWAATWALNTLIGLGKAGDWNVHGMGRVLGAHTNATHGMTLSAVAMPYYRRVLPHGLARFRRYATAVWDVAPEGSDMDIALEGLARMEAWMREIGVVLSVRGIGVTEEPAELESLVSDMTAAVAGIRGGYLHLERADIEAILQESLAAE
ncbi:MAG: iron-containing alcohol dehydrogenase [Desulfovibrionaceae bacterium]|nr:iron-containing alcohol dehydrogenase [Desulfovibrionaceae bacterium]